MHTELRKGRLALKAPSEHRLSWTAGCFGVALCFFLLIGPVAFAQGFRGGQSFRGGSTSPGASFGAQGPAVVPPVARASQFGYRTGSTYRSPARTGNTRSNSFRYLPFAFYSAPYYYPNYYSDPGGYADMTPPAIYEADPSAGLADELAALHREVSEMHQMMFGGPPPEGQPSDAQQQTAAAPPTPPPPPLVLVFRDGTRLEVMDFAVIGQTFWDLSSHPTRKIALTQLNLDASIQATEARGAEFPSIQAP